MACQDLLHDFATVAADLRSSLRQAEAVAQTLEPFAPRLVDALRDIVQQWPDLTPQELFCKGLKFLQHKLTRALEVGPAVTATFGTWQDMARDGEAELAARLGLLMSAGQEGGIWLDQAPEDSHVEFSDAEFAVGSRLRWQMECPVGGGVFLPCKVGCSGS